MRNLIAFSLFTTAVVADECSEVCRRLPLACSSKGSYCKNGHACHDLHWWQQGTLICNHSVEGCSSKPVVLCSEARDIGPQVRPYLGRVLRTTADTPVPRTTTPGPTTYAEHEDRETFGEIFWITPETTRAPGTSTLAPTTVPTTPRPFVRPPPAGPIVNRGIRNMGATCYLAAIVQVLAHTDYVRSWFMNRDGNGEPVYAALQQMVHELYDANSPGPTTINRLLAALELPNRASDANTAMRLLLEKISIPNRTLGRMFEMDITKTLTCPNCAYKYSTDDFRKRVHVAQIPPNVREVPFSAVLADYFGPFCLKGKRCMDCGADCASTPLQPVLLAAPDVLVFNLNRGTSENRILTSVQIPSRIDLKDYVPSSLPEDMLRYRLVGVVRYPGGHFVADYRHPDSGTWFTADDSSVRPIPGPTVSGPQPYLLVFERYFG
jgi:hypothetical protein